MPERVREIPAKGIRTCWTWGTVRRGSAVCNLSFPFTRSHCFPHTHTHTHTHTFWNGKWSFSRGLQCHIQCHIPKPRDVFPSSGFLRGSLCARTACTMFICECWFMLATAVAMGMAKAVHRETIDHWLWESVSHSYQREDGMESRWPCHQMQVNYRNNDVWHNRISGSWILNVDLMIMRITWKLLLLLACDVKQKETEIELAANYTHRLWLTVWLMFHFHRTVAEAQHSILLY